MPHLPSRNAGWFRFGVAMSAGLASALVFSILLGGLPGCPVIQGAEAAVTKPNLISPLSRDFIFWTEAQSLLWTELIESTKRDCVLEADAAPGESCPAFVDGGCGPDARRWWRMIAHDAMTHNIYNKDTTKRGGCDGSLATKEELSRPENEDFDSTIVLYKAILDKAKLKAYKAPTNAWADIISLGGFLGLYICGGPPVTFTSGRKDNLDGNGYLKANPPNLLPSRDDNTEVIAASFKRMNLSPKETVVVISSGHTIAGYHGENLDGTPNNFDLLYFKQLVKMSAPSTLKSDSGLLNRAETASWIKYWAQDDPTSKLLVEFRAATVQSALKMSYLGQPSSVIPYNVNMGTGGLLGGLLGGLINIITDLITSLLPEENAGLKIRVATWARNTSTVYSG